MQNIYCIVGPSGCGKTTLVEALQEKYGYKTIESYTTRPPCYEGETGHIFVTPEEFKALGEMCAYTKFDGYEYGVTADLIEQNDLYVIEPAGVEFLQEKYHGSKNIVVIGLETSKDVIVKRMTQRGDSPEKIKKRLANDAVMFKDYKDLCDSIVNAEVSIDELCEDVHIVIRREEWPYMREYSLIDENGRVLNEGARFHTMEAALQALTRNFPDGLPAGWHLRDDTKIFEDKLINAVKRCCPSFKRSQILLDGTQVQVWRSDFYLIAPFTYHGKNYLYRAYASGEWVEECKLSLDKQINACAAKVNQTKNTINKEQEMSL